MRFREDLSQGKPDEMDVIKFRDNTMICVCITKITLIYGVVKLHFGIRLEYCIDCVYDLFKFLNL